MRQYTVLLPHSESMVWIFKDGIALITDLTCLEKEMRKIESATVFSILGGFGRSSRAIEQAIM